MKKILVAIGLVVLLVGVLVVPTLAAGPNGKAGKSYVGHLYLFEKDPSTWDVVEGGAWGKLKYNFDSSSFDYVFNGHDLVPDTQYTLIRYIDPWGEGVVVLGTGTANEEGNIHLAGGVGTLGNANTYDYGTGYKIWLVPTSDVSGSTMIGWNPTEYLFEADLIYHNDWF